MRMSSAHPLWGAALLAAVLPTQAASVDLLASYAINGSTAIDLGGVPGHSGAWVQPGWDGDGNFLNLAEPLVQAPGPTRPFGEARANGNVTGDVAVMADFFQPTGGPVDHLRGQVVWSETVHNQSGIAQDYRFDFHVAAGGVLAAADAAGLNSLADGMQASYAIDIRLNGQAIWGSGATLSVAKSSVPQYQLLTSGVALGNSFSSTLGALEPGHPCQGYGGCIGYVFAGYDGALPLGTWADGASFTVSYRMAVDVSGPTYETGALAAFGDPLSLSGGTRIGSVVQVPEPATVAMLLAGLGVIGARRLRRLGR